jgi:cytochrome b6-f complex iron-sulfur subunit
VSRSERTTETVLQQPGVSGSRRGFFGWLARLAAAVLAATIALWTAAAARFAIPNVTARADQRVKVGPPAAYPRGHVETKYRQGHGIWVVHECCGGLWQIVALSTACTHLGCVTLWREELRKFKCPCHGSGFAADGLNCEGPAPRPLVRYAIRLAEDGQLEVDRGRTFHHDRGQWEDPACFVNTAGNS